MADLGLEERWKALGDAVDAWLDREAELDRVDRLAESMLSAASGGSIERLLQSVELLLITTLHDLVWQGREHELGPLLVAVFGPEDGLVVERQFRDWMASKPLLG